MLLPKTKTMGQTAPQINPKMQQYKVLYLHHKHTQAIDPTQQAE